MKMKLWKIKMWLWDKPLIYFYYFMSKVFKILYKISDEIGYLMFGKNRWEQLKREYNVE